MIYYDIKTEETRLRTNICLLGCLKHQLDGAVVENINWVWSYETLINSEGIYMTTDSTFIFYKIPLIYACQHTSLDSY